MCLSAQPVAFLCSSALIFQGGPLKWFAELLMLRRTVWYIYFWSVHGAGAKGLLKGPQNIWERFSFRQKLELHSRALNMTQTGTTAERKKTQSSRLALSPSQRIITQALRLGHKQVRCGNLIYEQSWQ